MVGSARAGVLCSRSEVFDGPEPQSGTLRLQSAEYYLNLYKERYLYSVAAWRVTTVINMHMPNHLLL